MIMTIVVRIHIVIQHTLLTYHTHTHTQTHNMDESIYKYPCTTTRPPSWWLGPFNFQVALYIFYMLYTFVGARIRRPGTMLPHCQSPICNPYHVKIKSSTPPKYNEDKPTIQQEQHPQVESCTPCANPQNIYHTPTYGLLHL